MTHGCRAARHCILPGEKKEEFEALRQYWFDVYQPVNMEEAQLVTKIAEAQWRSSRCERLLVEAKTMLARMERYQREAASQLKTARRAYDAVANS